MILRATIAAAALFAPGAGNAQALDFPAAAVPIANRTVAQDSYFIALAPFEDGPINGVTAEGALRQQSWKVGAGGLTTLQILVPLRDQLEQAGFETLFECETRICGGFDFRYQIEVLPEPDMHVNLGDFRYLAMRRMTGDAADYVSLMVSRSTNAGFVQLTEIGSLSQSTAVTASTKTPDPRIVLEPQGPVGEQLETLGHATLDDLTFKTGSADLGDDVFASLNDLAEYLMAHPNAQVMLVGHTDTDGSLEGNIALSRKRAASVVERLVSKYAVPRAQISAEGIGFLAPRASNLTEIGRAQNRRVEVILTSTK